MLLLPSYAHKSLICLQAWGTILDSSIVLSYFTNNFFFSRQRVSLNGRCSLYLYTSAGVLQRAFLSPFPFSSHTDSVTSCHSRLLKYVDNCVLSRPYSKCSDQKGLDNDVTRLATWGVNYGLIISKIKCAVCLSLLQNHFLSTQVLRP